MIKTRHIKRREQEIRSGTNFRHGMTTIGSHVNSVRQSPHGDNIALRLASRLSLRLGLRLGLGGSSLSLVQDKFDNVIFKVGVGAVDHRAVTSKVPTAPLVGRSRRGLASTLSRRRGP
eukprot:8035839-Heterocapsa_arctica.AAC.1